MAAQTDFLQYKADKIRIKSLEATTEAASGHPTSCLSAAEILSVLFFDQMIFDPKHPASYEGDDFVLSKGHAAPGLYASMNEAGMISDKELLSLRKFGSSFEGHPVPKVPGVRLATGSLGQGLSGAIGLSLAMKADGIDRFVYVLLGDGEMMEGQIWEAMHLAAHKKLGNIIAIVDTNRLGQSGPTVYGWEAQRYLDICRALDWHTAAVDGHNIDELAGTLRLAREEKQPSIIFAQTIKGKGVSFLENIEGKHGKPVSSEELIEAKYEIEEKMKPVEEKTPENWHSFSPPPLPEKASADISASYSVGEETATRDAFGSALLELGKKDPDIFVLDGDVKNSTRTKAFFDAFPGRGIECFIAEQNMLVIAAGLQARGKKPFAASFAAFLSRAHDQMRMASYSLADIKIAGSHTGVSIGEDGPSQMGLEDIAMTRSLFGSTVLSPCDAVSAEKCTAEMAARRGISYMRTIRGKTPVIYSDKEEFPIGGSKIVRQSDNDKAFIIAAGICVHEALQAADDLEEEGISVGVIDAYSLKPLDGNGLLAAAARVPFFLTVEDHYPEGGLGEAVSAVVRGQTAVYSQAVETLPHSGNPRELIAEQGIDAFGIKQRLRTIISALDSA